MIHVLCVQDNSNYFRIHGLDLWTKERNAYNFRGSGKIIAHPPCQQWSKLYKFAKDNPEEKGLAPFCWDLVKKHGGIFEHPEGSQFIKLIRKDTAARFYRFDQSWFGFPAKKSTILAFVDCYPATYKALGFVSRKVSSLHSHDRSKMTLEFCQFLVNSIQPEIDSL